MKTNAYLIRHKGEKTRYLSLSYDGIEFDLVETINEATILTLDQVKHWAKRLTDPRYKVYKISLEPYINK